MRNSLVALGALAVVSLTMRYLSSADSPEAEPIPVPRKQLQGRGSQNVGDLDYVLGAHPAPTSKSGVKATGNLKPGTPPGGTVCDLYEPMEEVRYTKVGPYVRSSELRQDLENRELWIRQILVQPVRRKGRMFGLQLSLKTPNPFSRLGLRNGDIVISLNGFDLSEVDHLPSCMHQLTTSSSLHFSLERKGVLTDLDVQLL